MMEFLKDAFQFVYDVEGLIRWGGTFLVCTIVFVETGLFVGFFLPGTLFWFRPESLPPQGI